MVVKRIALGCAVLAIAIGFPGVSCTHGEKVGLGWMFDGGAMPDPGAPIEANPAPRGWEDRRDQWELVWRDEFTGGTGENFHNGLDLGNWTIDTGTGAQYGLNGWGNYELQYYSRDNVSVRDGMLVIEANNVPFRTRDFTSGKITSGGNLSSTGYGSVETPERFALSEGFIEARIRTPRGMGFWPAFWTLGTTSNRFGNAGYIPVGHPNRGWPRGGEIDIMEMRGGREDRHTSAIHFWQGRHQYRHSNMDVRNGLPRDVDMSSHFHVYGVRWDAEAITFYFNGVPWWVVDLHSLAAEGVNTAAFTADTGQLININLALGGWFVDMAAPPASLFAPDAPWENRSLMVDWVRAYRRVGGNSVVHIRGERMPSDWTPNF